MELKDEAQIGSADFGHVSYDEQTRTVTIECNIPVTISIRVARLAVTVEETGERLGLARYREVLGGESYSGQVFPRWCDRFALCSSARTATGSRRGAGWGPAVG